jgi:hypothetical protein
MVSTHVTVTAPSTFSVTTESFPTLTAGNYVTVSGCTNAANNGTFLVTGTPTSSSFVVTSTSLHAESPGASVTVTAGASPGLPAVPGSDPGAGPLEYIGYENTRDIRGNSNVRASFLCNEADGYAYQSFLLRATSAEFPWLVCVAIRYSYLNRDHGTGKVQLDCEFVPAFKLLSLVPDSPLYQRHEMGSESFTVNSIDKSGLIVWDWNSGDPVMNMAVLPLIIVAVDNITLYGTKTNYLASDYSTWIDHLNSDPFLGFTAGHVACLGVSASHRMLEDGVMTNDIELHLKGRWIATWNSFYNETTGAWEEIKKHSGGANLYPTAAFSGLNIWTP